MTNFKVGDIVKPKIGPHKGQNHKIIHDHGNGRYNIRPQLPRPDMIKYRLGAATAHAADLEKVSSIKEENINELSKKTLGNYVKAASDDVSHNSFMSGVHSEKGMNPKNRDKEHGKSMEYDKKSFKRQGFIGKAVDRLMTKEEPEEVNELSRNTLRSYAAKSLDKLARAMLHTVGRQKTSAKERHKLDNRFKGYDRASKKLAHMKEEPEEVTEAVSSKNVFQRVIDFATKVGYKVKKEKRDRCERFVFTNPKLGSTIRADLYPSKNTHWGPEQIVKFVLDGDRSVTTELVEHFLDIFKEHVRGLKDDAWSKKKSMHEESLDEGMPQSVIKHKTRISGMSDADFAKSHANKSDDELIAMARRHGYGEGSRIYVNKKNSGTVKESRDDKAYHHAQNISSLTSLYGSKAKAAKASAKALGISDDEAKKLKPAKYKVGDQVTVNHGPHKGEPHTVVKTYHNSKYEQDRHFYGVEPNAKVNKYEKYPEYGMKRATMHGADLKKVVKEAAEPPFTPDKKKVNWKASSHSRAKWLAKQAMSKALSGKEYGVDTEREMAAKAKPKKAKEYGLKEGDDKKEVVNKGSKNLTGTKRDMVNLEPKMIDTMPGNSPVKSGTL